RPTRPEIEKQRAIDAAVLAKTQRPDGGWGYWSGMKTDDLVTMQVLQALSADKVGTLTTVKATEYVTKQANVLFARLEKAAALPAPQRKDRADYPYVVSLAAMSLTA